jgi:hypothetical protein
MATLETVVTELKELNDYSDLHLDAQFEISDRVGQLSERMQELTSVMLTFMNTVPEALSRGFQDLIQTEESIADRQKKDADTRERLKRRDEGGDDGGGEKKPGKIKGAFLQGFEEGMNPEKLGFVSMIADFAATLGEWAGKVALGWSIFASTFPKTAGVITKALTTAGKAVSGASKFLLSSIKALGRGMFSLLMRIGTTLIQTVLPAIGSALTATLGFISATVMPMITGLFTGLMTMLSPIVAALAPILLPIAAIAAAVTALVSGIMSFIDGFKNQEGTLLDKIFGGVAGFIKGIMKILTIPLDWIKDLISGILGFFGFDGAAEILDSFSFTDIFGSMIDAVKDFVIGLKDGIVDAIVGFASKLNPLNWFGDDEEEEEKSTKRGMEIPSATDDTNFSEEGKRRLDEFTGKGETSKTAKKVGEVVVEEDGVARTDFSEEELKQINAARTASIAMGGPDLFPQAEGAEPSAQASEPTKVPEKRGRVIGEAPPVPTKVSKETGKRGRVIGEAPPAPTKINTATGKRGGIIGTPQAGVFMGASGSDLDDGEYDNIQPVIDTDIQPQIEDLKTSPFDGLLDPLIEGFNDIKEWVGGLFDFGKIKKLIKGLFEGFGIPRIEFDVPLVGKVGFGPFYPFAPESSADVAGGVRTSSDTEFIVNSGSEYDSTNNGDSQRMSGRTSTIEQDKVISSATSNEREYRTNEFGEKEIVEKTSSLLARFDDDTAKGNVYIDTGTTIDNLVTDEFEQLEDTYDKFEVGPKVFEQVRQMVDSGASPEQVKEFLQDQEKFATKVKNFFSSMNFTFEPKEPEETPEAKNGDAFSSDMAEAEQQFSYPVTDPVTGELLGTASTPEEAAQIAMETGGKIENAVSITPKSPELVGGNQESAQRSNVLDMEQKKAEMNKEQESATAAGNAVFAPTQNSNVSNSTTINSGPMPSPMDKSDRTARGAYRGRKI